MAESTPWPKRVGSGSDRGIHSTSANKLFISLLTPAKKRPRSLDTASKVDQKFRSKGDPDDCNILSYESNSSNGAAPPCRLPTIDETAMNTSNLDYKKRPPPPNQITVGAYVGTPPFARTTTALFTDIVTSVWNENLTNIEFFLDPRYDKYYQQPPMKDPPKPRDPQDAGTIRSIGIGTIVGQGVDEQGNRQIYLEQRYQTKRMADTNRIEKFHLYHTISISQLLPDAKHDLRWWWLVNITYECYWADNAEPVGQTVMDEIHRNMSVSLAKSRDEVERRLKHETQSRVMRVRTVQDGIPDAAADNLDMKDDVPTTDPDPSPVQDTKSEPLDRREWDWMKWLGLALLTGSLSMALVLRLFSERRLRLRKNHLYWGNLNTKEGVDHVLSTGWVVEGSNLQIYDKTNFGYNDDDSLFLGGFEQREIVVGKEVSMTQLANTDTTYNAGGSHSCYPSD